ncbi:MAG: hypothetical protein K0B81_05140 [Candidatus Cloacimonetes bacterium]|nr:hypothetical protein [Candidatus Cloacimonadota bacterium]
MKKYLAIGVLLFGLSGYLIAFPFINYGNVRVPDAYVMPHLMGKVSINNYVYPENDRKNDNYSYNWATGINFGLFNYGEVGFVASGDEIYYAHVKVKLLTETSTLPDMAVGVDNLFSKIPSKGPFKPDYPDIVDVGNYRQNSIYIAFSKTTIISGIPQFRDLPTRITVGAGSHRFHGSVQISEQFEGIFGALQFEPARNFTIISEIDGHNWNTGFEYRYHNFSGRFDLYRMEEWNRRDPKFGLTLSYVFDNFVSPENRRDLSPFRSLDRQYIPVREGTSLDELQRIRRQRERAEQELEEIRKLLEEE